MIPLRHKSQSPLATNYSDFQTRRPGPIAHGRPSYAALSIYSTHTSARFRTTSNSSCRVPVRCLNRVLSSTLNIQCLFKRTTLFDIIVKLCKTEAQNLILNHHTDRDAQLIAEATSLIESRMADGAPESIMAWVRLRTWLEVESILCEEYRYDYRISEALVLMFTTLLSRKSIFAVINLTGSRLFESVPDFHNQRDGILEADAARLDDMLERIRFAAAEY